jgi:nucleoside-diphosphate-sugar epimerase
MANLKAAVAPAEDCAGRAFNIAGGGAFSLLDVLQVLGELLEVNVAPTFERSRPGDVRHTLAVTANAVRYLSHQAESSFREGLRRTIAWHGVAR